MTTDNLGAFKLSSAPACFYHLICSIIKSITSYYYTPTEAWTNPKKLDLDKDLNLIFTWTMFDSKWSGFFWKQTFAKVCLLTNGICFLVLAYSKTCFITSEHILTTLILFLWLWLDGPINWSSSLCHMIFRQNPLLDFGWDWTIALQYPAQDNAMIIFITTDYLLQ